MNEIDRQIDQSLSTTHRIEPSPFFVKRVMSAVLREATFPPLAFPWKRLAAAALFLLVMIVAGVGDGYPMP